MSIRKQMESEMKPFIKDGKAVIYPIVGDVFVTKAGVVYLNGNKSSVQEAIQAGQLEGVIASSQDWFLVPQFEMRRGNYRVRAVQNCSTPRLYGCLNEGIELKAKVDGVYKR
jgi:hypothetical protein